MVPDDNNVPGTDFGELGFKSLADPQLIFVDANGLMHIHFGLLTELATFFFALSYFASKS